MTGISQPSPTSTAAYSSQFDYVNVDDLTEFCETQLQACDTKIHELTSDQQTITSDAEAVGNAQAALNALAASVQAESNSNLTTSSDVKTAAALKLADTVATLTNLAKSATGEAQSKIQAEINSLQGDCTIDGNGKVTAITTTITPDMVSGLAKDLQPTADSLSTDQSLNMIKVQSAVSQREQMVQLVTGMIQKMDEMVSSVVANIGK